MNRNSIIIIQENATENVACQNGVLFVQGEMGQLPYPTVDEKLRYICNLLWSSDAISWHRYSWINIGSSHGLLLDDTNPIPATMIIGIHTIANSQKSRKNVDKNII